MTGPVICFGQQPCGFLPKRFLVAKLATARRLQAEIGGEIVFFVHDSDHDPRETRTILRHRATSQPLTFNFTFENKLQKKFSPMFAKRVPAGWREGTARQLPAYLDQGLVEVFRANEEPTIAGFCLEMYRRLGFLDGIRVERSGSPEFRKAACAIDDCFVDVTHEGELVRARWAGGALQLHEGGDSYVTLPSVPFEKSQVSPTRDSRLRWMQSVIRCTHYIAGAGEQAYLRKDEAPEITFVNRDPIDNSDEAYCETPS